MQKSIIILVVLAIVIIGIIFLILYLKSDEQLDVETANCISSKSALYVSSACGHCTEQEAILGDSIKLFNIIDCLDNVNQELCKQNNILSVPAWVIEHKSYLGVKTISQLKSLTGC